MWANRETQKNGKDREGERERERDGGGRGYEKQTLNFISHPLQISSLSGKQFQHHHDNEEYLQKTTPPEDDLEM